MNYRREIEWPTVKQNARMASMGMMEVAMKQNDITWRRMTYREAEWPHGGDGDDGNCHKAEWPTVKQNDRMAGMGMMEAAMKAARLQMVVVTTDTPDFLITSPTWS